MLLLLYGHSCGSVVMDYITSLYVCDSGCCVVSFSRIKHTSQYIKFFQTKTFIGLGVMVITVVFTVGRLNRDQGTFGFCCSTCPSSRNLENSL